MAVTYIPYQAKKILNAYKHVDGAWFWVKVCRPENPWTVLPNVGNQIASEIERILKNKKGKVPK